MNFAIIKYMENENCLSVSEITEYIKALLEEGFPSITVEGEISNFRPSSTGHYYFTLKDEKASISCVMFKGKTRFLTFEPKDGMKVMGKGSISVFQQRGSYQIIFDSLAETGSGNILALLEERKQKFYAEGLFAEERKKTIPVFPETIAVVTSPTGAALRDILQILRRRNPTIFVNILPAPVQGNEAAPIIAEQIETANRFKMGDVIIVGRGGGSLEDLLPFSEEVVVRAIANSKIPVISAVGHEIDWALSDYVADKRAPTPSAAAELASPVLSEILSDLATIKTQFKTEMDNRLQKLKLIAKQFSSQNLETEFYRLVQPKLLQFDDAKENLFDSIFLKIKETKQKINLLTTKLEANNPERILQKGYSMVIDQDSGKIIRSKNDTKIGNKVTIKSANAQFTAEIQNIQNEAL